VDEERIPEPGEALGEAYEYDDRKRIMCELCGGNGTRVDTNIPGEKPGRWRLLQCDLCGGDGYRDNPDYNPQPHQWMTEDVIRFLREHATTEPEDPRSQAANLIIYYKQLAERLQEENDEYARRLERIESIIHTGEVRPRGRFGGWM